MFTKEYLEKAKKEQLNLFKDNPEKPKPMFINGKFNPDNWNSGDGNFIRNFSSVIEDFYNRDIEASSTIDGDEEESDKDVIVSYANINEQKYIIISVFDIQRVILLSQYFITYYKNRGSTEGIYKNGKLITEEEYIDILNTLHESNITDMAKY